MKIVVVSMIKNEEVLIESSIRYWFTFADQIILFDHDSKDGTMPIVNDLMAEFGDKLVLFNEHFSMGVEYKQAEVTNAMVEAAFNQYGADSVMPLDADEFPYLTEPGSLRDFMSSLPQSSCYMAFWMPFAPPQNDVIDHSVFAPFSFTRKKCKPMEQWCKIIISRNCFLEYRPILSIGNHSFIHCENRPIPPIMDLGPRLYYAHYPCRGKSHYMSKNLNGWLAIYSDINWQPGSAEQYRLACEQILKEEVTDQIVTWYCMSSFGMTGESIEEIENSIEIIDPHSIYPDIPVVYTQKHIQNKEVAVLLFESAIKLVEQYRELSTVQREPEIFASELEKIKKSKAYKLGNFLATPVRFLREWFLKIH